MEYKDLTSLDWSIIVQKIVSMATSEMAREKLKSLKPLSSVSDCEQAFSKISEVKNLMTTSGIRPFMESLDLYGLWHPRLSKGATLKPLELKDVRHFLFESQALKEVLSMTEAPYLKNLHEIFFEASEGLSAIDQLMTSDGGIRTDASETLYNLHQEKTLKAREVSKILDKLISEHELEHILQDKYVTTREGRWVLPVKSGMQGQFEGIIHASSQSKQTVFMEPKEVIKTNNRLREVESEIEQEVEKLLTSLSQYLHSLLPSIEAAQHILLELDIAYAKAQYATLTRSNRIHFSDDTIELIDVKHPALVLDEEVKVMPNSVTLDTQHRILILSGPNAGGKTILLKAIGLAAQMARCGLLVCADETSKIPFFKTLHVGVGDAQSVDSHLSTFAAHLKILDQAAKAKGSTHLLLIDEICGSTDPEEGTALARSFIQKFSTNKVFGVITSHLGPLKSGWNESSAVINGSLEYNSESGQPTYQFLTGVPGQSLAIQTARRVGVDNSIVENAVQLLSPEMKKYLHSLDELETQKKELRTLQRELQEKSKEAAKEKSKYHSLVQRFEKDKDKMLNTVVKRAEKRIDRIADFSKVDTIFKKHSTTNTLKKQLPQIIKPTASREACRFESAEEFAEAYPPGSKVFSSSIGKDGIVQGPPNSKGEVPILSQSMRLLIHWSELTSPMVPNNPTQKILKKLGHGGNDQLDIRGMRVEQALEKLEIHLDKAALHQVDRIKIIHGHGTDTLKRAVRSYLSRSLYVKKWNSGAEATGGDGITWAEIKDS